MNILFLGNFEAHHSSETYYRNTLQKMGHNVICVQEGKQTCNSLLLAINREKPDYFFWVHTHGWHTPDMEKFLQACKHVGIITFAYHLDLYLGIQREIQMENDPFFKVDHFFTVDALMARHLNENTECNGHFLPAGVYEDDCYREAPSPEKYPHEIIFTGATNYHPEWPYRKKLVSWLKDTYGNKFAHYGPGGLDSIRGYPELNKLYASAKIVIGDTLCKDFTYPFYSSDRLFEVIGRGGFLIYPEIKGLDKYYKDMDDIVYYTFNDFNNLKFLIDKFLADNSAREVIMNRGFWRTRKEHTYRHRFEEILLYLEGFKK
jgi:hypothetical protein